MLENPFQAKDIMRIIDKWRPIQPLDSSVEKTLSGDVAVVDSLRDSWTARTSSLASADRAWLRRRTLRKHAIETGIIEGLYDIDRGLTETLVAEGLTMKAVARAGGKLPAEVLEMLVAQYEGLELVTEYVNLDLPPATSLVKELHALITRTQTHYDAADSLGRRFQAELSHGSYKKLPNNVLRSDGSLLEFAPPEQVPGEIERLVELYNGMDGIHPLISAAWMHHRFVQIHPFQDGNGRVARALTLFALERSEYAPMVVDRDSRPRYLAALDDANEGNLVPLGKLFTELAVRSIRDELKAAMPEPSQDTGAHS